MRYLQGIVILVLLLFSKRYRQHWAETTAQISSARDAVDASMRRLEAARNGGKPRLRVLSGAAARAPSPQREPHEPGS